MADENSSDFRFDDDDQEPESFYHEELKDLRIEKLSHRVTLLTILLPCVLAVAIYFGYQNLSGKVSQSHETVSFEIQRLTEKLENLSRNFNEKLITFSTTLSTQDKDFGTSIEGRLFALNKNIDLLQKNFNSLSEDLKRSLKLNQDTIEKLKVSKADKKSQAAAVEKLNAAISPLKKELQNLKTVRQDINAISSEIKKLESHISKKLNAVADKADQAGKNYEKLGKNYEQLGKNHEQLAASLTKLSGQAIDEDALALEVFKLRKNFQNQLSDEVSNLNRRLDSIQKEIDGVSSNAKTQKQSMKRASKKTIPRQSDTAPVTGSGSVEQPNQSGSITEKDLIE